MGRQIADVSFGASKMSRLPNPCNTKMNNIQTEKEIAQERKSLIRLRQQSGLKRQRKRENPALEIAWLTGEPKSGRPKWRRIKAKLKKWRLAQQKPPPTRIDR